MYSTGRTTSPPSHRAYTLGSPRGDASAPDVSHIPRHTTTSAASATPSHDTIGKWLAKAMTPRQSPRGVMTSRGGARPSGGEDPPCTAGTHPHGRGPSPPSHTAPHPPVRPMTAHSHSAYSLRAASTSCRPHPPTSSYPYQSNTPPPRQLASRPQSALPISPRVHNKVTSHAANPYGVRSIPQRPYSAITRPPTSVVHKMPSPPPGSRPSLSSLSPSDPPLIHTPEVDISSLTPPSTHCDDQGVLNFNLLPNHNTSELGSGDAELPTVAPVLEGSSSFGGVLTTKLVRPNSKQPTPTSSSLATAKQISTFFEVVDDVTTRHINGTLPPGFHEGSVVSPLMVLNSNGSTSNNPASKVAGGGIPSTPRVNPHAQPNNEGETLSDNIEDLGLAHHPSYGLRIATFAVASTPPLSLTDVFNQTTGEHCVRHNMPGRTTSPTSRLISSSSRPNSSHLGPRSEQIRSPLSDRSNSTTPMPSHSAHSITCHPLLMYPGAVLGMDALGVPRALTRNLSPPTNPPTRSTSSNINAAIAPHVAYVRSIQIKTLAGAPVRKGKGGSSGSGSDAEEAGFSRDCFIVCKKALGGDAEDDCEVGSQALHFQAPKISSVFITRTTSPSTNPSNPSSSRSSPPLKGGVTNGNSVGRGGGIAVAASTEVTNFPSIVSYRVNRTARRGSRKTSPRSTTAMGRMNSAAAIPNSSSGRGGPGAAEGTATASAARKRSSLQLSQSSPRPNERNLVSSLSSDVHDTGLMICHPRLVSTLSSTGISQQASLLQLFGMQRTAKLVVGGQEAASLSPHSRHHHTRGSRSGKSVTADSGDAISVHSINTTEVPITGTDGKQVSPMSVAAAAAGSIIIPYHLIKSFEVTSVPLSTVENVGHASAFIPTLHPKGAVGGGAKGNQQPLFTNLFTSVVAANRADGAGAGEGEGLNLTPRSNIRTFTTSTPPQGTPVVSTHLVLFSSSYDSSMKDAHAYVSAAIPSTFKDGASEEMPPLTTPGASHNSERNPLCNSSAEANSVEVLEITFMPPAQQTEYVMRARVPAAGSTSPSITRAVGDHMSNSTMGASGRSGDVAVLTGAPSALSASTIAAVNGNLTQPSHRLPPRGARTSDVLLAPTESKSYNAHTVACEVSHIYDLATTAGDLAEEVAAAAAEDMDDSKSDDVFVSPPALEENNLVTFQRLRDGGSPTHANETGSNGSAASYTSGATNHRSVHSNATTGPQLVFTPAYNTDTNNSITDQQQPITIRIYSSRAAEIALEVKRGMQKVEVARARLDAIMLSKKVAFENKAPRKSITHQTSMLESTNPSVAHTSDLPPTASHIPTFISNAPLRSRRDNAIKSLTIVHFNDVYNLDTKGDPDPRGIIGGATRFHTVLERIRQLDSPLVLFSGDFMGPSLMSVEMKGRQIIDCFNLMGVHFGTFGNHEFDYGKKALNDAVHGYAHGSHVYAGSNTKWVMTNMFEGVDQAAKNNEAGGNVEGDKAGAKKKISMSDMSGGKTVVVEDNELDPERQKILDEKKKKDDMRASVKLDCGPEPICGASRTELFVWNGVVVGIMGISDNWLPSCSQLTAGDFAYADMYETGERVAVELRGRGAEVVICLAHSRVKQDADMMRRCPSIDLMLGGHDHFFKCIPNLRFVKSGEEFHFLTEIRLDISPNGLITNNLASPLDDSDAISNGSRSNQQSSNMRRTLSTSEVPTDSHNFIPSTVVDIFNSTTDASGDGGDDSSEVYGDDEEEDEDDSQSSSDRTHTTTSSGAAVSAPMPTLRSPIVNSGTYSLHAFPECNSSMGGSRSGVGRETMSTSVSRHNVSVLGTAYNTNATMLIHPNKQDGMTTGRRKTLLSAMEGKDGDELCGGRFKNQVMNISITAHPITIDIPESPAMKKLLNKYLQKLDERMGRVIGKTPVPLDPREVTCRFKEGLLTGFVCDVIVSELKGLKFKADFALLGGAAFSGKTLIPAGDIKIGNIFSCFPNDTQIMCLRMNGETVIRLLNAMIKEMPEEAPSFPHCSSDLKFVINLFKRPAQVEDVRVRGEPIGLTTKYIVGLETFAGTGKAKYKFVPPNSTTLIDEENASQLVLWLLDYFTENKGAASDAVKSNENPDAAGAAGGNSNGLDSSADNSTAGHRIKKSRRNKRRLNLLDDTMFEEEMGGALSEEQRAQRRWIRDPVFFPMRFFDPRYAMKEQSASVITRLYIAGQMFANIPDTDVTPAEAQAELKKSLAKVAAAQQKQATPQTAAAIHTEPMSNIVSNSDMSMTTKLMSASINPTFLGTNGGTPVAGGTMRSHAPSIVAAPPPSSSPLPIPLPKETRLERIIRRMLPSHYARVYLLDAEAGVLRRLPSVAGGAFTIPLNSPSAAATCASQRVAVNIKNMRKAKEKQIFNPEFDDVRCVICGGAGGFPTSSDLGSHDGAPLANSDDHQPRPDTPLATSSRSCCSYLQPIETLLSTPVIFKDQVMGVIQVLNRSTEDIRKRKGGYRNGGSAGRQGATRSSVKAAMLMSVTGCSPTNISADPVDLFESDSDAGGGEKESSSDSFDSSLLNIDHIKAVPDPCGSTNNNEDAFGNDDVPTVYTGRSPKQSMAGRASNLKYTDEERDLLSLLGHSLGSHFHHRNISLRMDRSETVNTELMKMAQMLGTASRDDDVKEIILKITAAACSVFNCDRSSLFLLDKGMLWTVVKSQDKLQNVTIRFPVGKGVAGHCAETGVVLNIHDAYKSDLFNQNIDRQTGYVTKTILAVPMMAENKVDLLGVLQLINKRDGTVFGVSDERTASDFVALAAMAVHNSFEIETLRLDGGNVAKAILPTHTLDRIRIKGGWFTVRERLSYITSPEFHAILAEVEMMQMAAALEGSAPNGSLRVEDQNDEDQHHILPATFGELAGGAAGGGGAASAAGGIPMGVPFTTSTGTISRFLVPTSHLEDAKKKEGGGSAPGVGSTSSQCLANNLLARQIEAEAQRSSAGASLMNFELPQLDLRTDRAAARRQGQLHHKLDSIRLELEKLAQWLDTANTYTNSTFSQNETNLLIVAVKLGELATSMLECDRATVWFINDGHIVGLQNRKIPLRFPVGRGLAGKSALTGEVLNIPDAYECRHFNQSVDKQTGYRTKQILCMPMLQQEDNGLIGLLQCINKDDDTAFNHDDEQAARVLMSQAVTIIRYYFQLEAHVLKEPPSGKGVDAIMDD